MMCTLMAFLLIKRKNFIFKISFSLFHSLQGLCKPQLSLFSPFPLLVYIVGMLCRPSSNQGCKSWNLLHRVLKMPPFWSNFSLESYIWVNYFFSHLCSDSHPRMTCQNIVILYLQLLKAENCSRPFPMVVKCFLLLCDVK